MHSVITVIFLSCFIKSIKHQSKPLASLSCICPWRAVWRLHVFGTGAVKSAIPLPASHFICEGMQWSGVRPLQRCWIVRLMTGVLRDSVSRAKPLWLTAQLQPQTGVMCFAVLLLLKHRVFLRIKRNNGNWNCNGSLAPRLISNLMTHMVCWKNQCVVLYDSVDECAPHAFHVRVAD